MQLSRRSFVGSSALAVAAVSSTGLMTGCPLTTDWITKAVNAMPTVIALAEAITQIVAIASGNALLTPVVSLAINKIADMVKAGLATLKTLLDDFNTNKNPTTLGKIQDTIADILTQLPSIYNLLNFNDTDTKASIAGAIAALIGALGAVQLLIPTVASAATGNKVSARTASARTSPLAKKTLIPDVAQIKSQFNATVILNGYSQVAIQ